MGKGLQPLKTDLRDRSYRRHVLFGAPSLAQLPRVYRASGSVSDDQQLTSEFCTDYTTVAIAEREDGKAYSREFHAKNESVLLGYNMAGRGCDLRTALKVAVEYGFLEKSLSPIDWKRDGEAFAADPANWPASLDAKAQPHAHPGYSWITGPYDRFDSVRAALWDKAPCGSISAGTPWFDSFEETGPDGIAKMPAGRPSAYHNHEILGWTEIKGAPHLISNSWQGDAFGNGGALYFSREVFNFIATYSGAALAALDDIDPDQVSGLNRRILSLMQILVDMYQSILANHGPAA